VQQRPSVVVLPIRRVVEDREGDPSAVQVIAEQIEEGDPVLTDGALHDHNAWSACGHSTRHHARGATRILGAVCPVLVSAPVGVRRVLERRILDPLHADSVVGRRRG
jgi:hypothetical protein